MIYDELKGMFVEAEPKYCAECGAMLVNCAVCGERYSKESMMICHDCKRYMCREHIAIKCKGCHGYICMNCKPKHKDKCPWTGTYTG